jgi:hypothetical protein
VQEQFKSYSKFVYPLAGVAGCFLFKERRQQINKARFYASLIQGSG